MQSPAQLLASLSEQDRQAWLSQLSTDQLAALRYNWEFWARPTQLEPEGHWRTWLALAGRGFGKTELGAQWIRKRVKNGAKLIALVAETQKDLEEVMIPRILTVTPAEEAPDVRYKPVRLRWPSGAVAYGYNGTEPDQLRGPEFDTAWVDELAKYSKARDTWDMLQFTMRKGNPRVLVTTTPRPIPIIKEIMAEPGTHLTRGKTMDNADNLAPSFMEKVVSKYAGTRLGRQELDGEIVDDVPGALWTREMLDATRVEKAPQMARVVVAIDPSGTDGDDEGDAIGIVVAGRGIDGRGYVLADRTCKLTPEGWARIAVTAYYEFEGDRIVAEKNFGGAMVKSVIRTADAKVPYKEVTASRGKAVRAEPVSALYEQGRISHVGGFAEMEDEMVLFTNGGYMGEKSPNRTDALVWALTEVMLAGQPPARDTGGKVAIPSTVGGFRR
ncbi:DNA-packaging protein [Allosphingosinicella flava]|uniref:DNA-packaging protein n=2 Tax=Allosphingosinicella flava TaxID=2771430 RepID=A0A7T2GLX2_9SPHN|nr:DNA-packaging protein [Sphingosinicella flava]